MGTRENPAPVGEALTLTLNTFGDADGSVWTLTVDLPGADITQAVLDENQFNSPPDPGFIFYGVPITLTLLDAGKEPLSTGFNISFEYFGRDSLSIYGGLADIFGCGVVPEELDGFKEVFIGGSVSGWICHPVTEADAAGGSS